MQISDKLILPGEHSLFLPGQIGPLESVIAVPSILNERYLAIIGHPHSLQGGTMSNKVVTTMVRAFKDLNIPSIRFNFRGVGRTTGGFDQGVGESEDMLEIAHLCQQEMPSVKLIFSGFSFGSYVAYRAAAQCEHALLITIAPPVHHFDYTEFSTPPNPWLMFQGDDDDVVPLQSILEFIAHSSYPIVLERFSETGHFFHGRLVDLKMRLIESIHHPLELV